MLALAAPAVNTVLFLPSKASALAWQFRVGIMNPVLLRTEIDPKYLRPLVFLSERSSTIFYRSFNKQVSSNKSTSIERVK